MITRLLIAFVLVALTPSAEWRIADPDYRWAFPRDHWSHPGFKTEWWYLTGRVHAVERPDEAFGYQFTFFRVGVSPESTSNRGSAWITPDLIMGHLAITDLRTGNHVFADLLYRTTPFLGGFGPPGDSVVAWSVAPPGTDGRWTLTWNDEGFNVRASDTQRGIALDIQTRSTTPVLFQGPNGYSRKGDSPTAASMYYSMPRLATTGSLRIDGREVAIRGTSWMDKEFGSNQLDSLQVGWDWFSMRLADGRDIMLYQLRRQDGSRDAAFGTVRHANGTVQYLDGSAWSIDARRAWTSSETDARYPVRWMLELPTGELLDLRAVTEESENVATRVPNLFYWEGAIDVRRNGDTIGEGYAELTGYGRSARPAI